MTSSCFIEECVKQQSFFSDMARCNFLRSGLRAVRLGEACSELLQDVTGASGSGYKMLGLCLFVY